MSKQRYLLITLIILSCSLAAQNSWKTEFIASVGDKEPLWIGRSNLNAELYIKPNLALNFRTKLESSDALEREFPQKTWSNSALSIKYTQPLLTAEASYRSTLWGSSKALNLYPVDSPGLDFRRNAEHQSSLSLSSEFQKLRGSAFAIHRQLRARPVSYVYDWQTDTTISEVHAEKGLDNVYAGADAAYQIRPYLRAGAFVRHSEAHFDRADSYRMDAAGLNAELEHKLDSNTRILGHFVWTNRFNENLSPESRNLLQSGVRIQRTLLPGLNSFVSYQNNSCTDAGLDTLYLISNQIRAQIQYHFSYDPDKDSYLLAGAKFSKSNEASAFYSEAQSRIMNRLYARVGWKWLPELYVQYTGRLGYFFYGLGEMYLLYQKHEPFPLQTADFHYLGFGSSIYF